MHDEHDDDTDKTDVLLDVHDEHCVVETDEVEVDENILVVHELLRDVLLVHVIDEHDELDLINDHEVDDDIEFVIDELEVVDELVEDDETEETDIIETEVTDEADNIKVDDEIVFIETEVTEVIDIVHIIIEHDEIVYSDVHDAYDERQCTEHDDIDGIQIIVELVMLLIDEVLLDDNTDLLCQHLHYIIIV